VSCASAGNCIAGGFYAVGRSIKGRAFIVSEKNGTWGGAQGVAVVLNAFGDAQVNSVSCASAGNCSVGGFYSDRFGDRHAFVVNEKNGRLGAAQEVAGKLNIGGGAQVESVSCASAGNCGAGGDYTPKFSGPIGHPQAFVVSES
jgi:hypothetical protein